MGWRFVIQQANGEMFKKRVFLNIGRKNSWGKQKIEGEEEPGKFQSSFLLM